MKVKIEKNTLFIECEINNPLIPSKKGKSLLLCSSGGNRPTEAKHNGKNVIIGLNAYIPVS